MAGKKTKKLVFGVGLNDFSPTKVNGVQIKSRQVWSDMLKRCYSERYQREKPTYKGCSVSDEWLKFSSFKEWFDLNYVDGYAIDKDILFPGNKVYSKETCVFIPRKLNQFITATSFHGEYPIGVSFNKCKGKFKASISHEDRTIYLGYFSSPMSAHMAWFDKKMSLAHGYEDLCDKLHPKLFSGLISKVNSMRCFNG